MKILSDIESLREYLTPEIAAYAGIGLATLIVIAFLFKLFGKKRPDKHFQVVECSDCGWHGEISRWAGRCPQCNKPLGDQKLKR
jgi:hypothetical protein